MPHLGGNEVNKPHVSHGESIGKLVTQDGTEKSVEFWLAERTHQQNNLLGSIYKKAAKKTLRTLYVFYFKMREQLQSPDFRNVCFPCSHFPGLVQVIEERHWNIESPCSSNRSSATSTTSSVSTSCRTEHTSPNEIERNSVMESVEPSVLTVGATAQLRRRNSSVSRGKPRLKSMQIMTTPNNDSLERSETFVAQDGVLTTNFCSTEL